MIEKVLEYLNTGRGEEMTDEMNMCSRAQSQLAIKQTMELNNRFHTPEEIVGGVPAKMIKRIEVK